MVSLYQRPRHNHASDAECGDRLRCLAARSLLVSGPFIRTSADKQTTVPGVYAAGDAARPGHNSLVGRR